MLLNHAGACDNTAASPQPLRTSPPALWRPPGPYGGDRYSTPVDPTPHQGPCPACRDLGGNPMWIIWLMNMWATALIMLSRQRPGSHMFLGHCICLGAATSLSRTLLHPITLRGACIEEVVGENDLYPPMPS